MASFAEALAGAQGGAISTAVLYPLEVIKTRMQASSKEKAEEQEQEKVEDEGKGQQPHEGEGAAAVAEPAQAEAEEKTTRTDDSSLVQVVREVHARSGVAGFFEGVHYAALQSAVEKWIYFYAYSAMKGACEVVSGGFSLGQNLVVGYLAETTHLPITVPLEVAITRIITSRGRIRSLRQAFEEAIEADGIAGLYKGISAYVVLCLKPAIQYTIYEQLRRGILGVLSRRRGTPITSLTALQAFALGALSRAVATLVIFPFIRAKKLLMAEQNAQQPKDSPPPSVVGMILRTVEAEGPLALFRGVGPELARGVLSAALMLMLKEKLQVLNGRGRARASPPQRAYK